MSKSLASISSVIVTFGLLIIGNGIFAFNHEDGTVTDEHVEAHHLESVSVVSDGPSHGATQCAHDSALADANYLYISTMDGKLHALDAMNGGREVWKADFDTEPLLYGTLSMKQPIQVEGRMFKLVPALDGTLYMYSYDEGLLEPIPINTDLLLEASIRVGHDALAGGRTISTTGVDPLTGEVRYHCSSSHCDTILTEPVTSTLIFRRSTSKVRAVDALSGSERWNLSVSEYDVTLAVARPRDDLLLRGTGFRYLIQPPNGVVTAFDNCGNKLWSQKLSSHIARAWKLEGGELKEVSLFNTDNIHTLFLDNDSMRGGIGYSESLFYLGTVNDEPFIINSAHVKNEMKRIMRNTDSTEPQTTATGQITRSSIISYFLEQSSVDELLSSLYKHFFGAHQMKNPNNQVVPRKLGDLQPVTINRGDQGWFVLHSNVEAEKLVGGFLDSSQCSVGIVERFSKTFQTDRLVSGWWRIVALVMLGLLGSVTIVIHALLNRRKQLQLFFHSPFSQFSSGMSSRKLKNRKADMRSTSAGPSIGRSRSLSTLTGGKVRQQRTNSSRESDVDKFHSKFVQDFEPVKLLGHGGFGVVFEAKNRLDECPYAVKRIAVVNRYQTKLYSLSSICYGCNSFSERAIQLVLREVRAMAKLDHPGIIRYYHTWIERPPYGWQEEQDSLMLCCMNLTGMETMRNRKKVKSVLPSVIIGEGDHTVSGPCEGISCLKDVKECVTSYSESSSDNDHLIFRNQHYVDSGNSESIVFDDGDCSKSKPINSHLSQPGKKMFFTTSSDKDLMPHSNAMESNFVYLYIQMQLCQEQTLHEWLSKHTFWEDRPIHKMKVWMVQMCSAVSYIHQQGLIHRDIKPQNIFFASDQTLKVGDLGLVTRCAPTDDFLIENKSSRLDIHTDNLANKPYTFKVDVFSLGLIFCELVIPFQTHMERSITLCTLQQGQIPDVLNKVPSESRKAVFFFLVQKIFVAWLTSVEPDCRPTCDEILASSYLTRVENETVDGSWN
ncbi:kinase domain protein [Dictyocaulus viviparus]|uniref:PRKR-like endoplasmic reticulum kinase n=1 Tax=Dictyocaulus viviparus TaxID=29172 RepID=A0A0D8XSQ4_DICVI|nr:kinase domain protein [Dictyocaulus viviparus]